MTLTSKVADTVGAGTDQTFKPVRDMLLYICVKLKKSYVPAQSFTKIKLTWKLELLIVVKDL